jgi:hypothetical protein
MPFGVELPEKYGGTAPNPVEKSSVESVDTETPTSTVPGGEAPDTETSLSEAAAPEATREIVDLDKLERFRFGGKELTAKELRNATLMREDYTRKTQEVAEARRYADNFPIDLEKVVRNPKLLSELKRIYPADYVKVAERLIKANSTTAPNPSDGKTQVAPEVMSKIEEIQSRLDTWDNQQRELQVQRLQSDLDKQFDTMSKKYPNAIPEVVNSRAIVVAENNHEITPKVIETLFKQHDDEMKKRVQSITKTRVEEQRKVNAQGRGIGAGGGTPGHAPKQAKTMKEAKAQMFADIAAGTFSRK